MILHLSPDTVFIKGAIEQFEKYYPGKNHFFIQISRFENRDKYLKNKQNNVFYIPFTKRNDLKFIKNYILVHKVKHVVVHYLSPSNAALANFLSSQLDLKTYWVFFGADLYNLIENEHPIKHTLFSYCKMVAYKLYFYSLFRRDEQQSIQKFIKNLNYFCFWNHFDYKLLKEKFNTNAEHKYFIYAGAITDVQSNTTYNLNYNKILINHSASYSGNHIDIFNKLASFSGKIENYEIVVPLSYGSPELTGIILEKGKHIFGEKFSPITEYMKKEDYFNEISNCVVAIFGHEKQEAAGNVFYLLSRGVKIFLRSESTLYHWLTEKGFLVFSYDEHLNSIEAFSPLSISDIKHNHLLFNEVFSEASTRSFMMNLIVT